MWWVDVASSQTSQASLTSHCCRMGRKQRKVRRLINQDNDNSTGKAKTAHEQSKKKNIFSTPHPLHATEGRCSATSWKAGLQHIGWLLGNTNAITTKAPTLLSPFPPPLAELLLLSTGMDYPFGQFGSTVLAGTPASLLPTLTLFTHCGSEV